RPNPEAELRQIERDKLDRQRREADLLRRSGAPPRHLNTTPLLEENWCRVDKTIRLHEETGFIIALLGQRGVGKTQLGVEAIKRAALAGRPSLYVTAYDLFLEVRSTYREGADKSEHDVLAKYSRPFLLVLDELGKRNETDWENNLLVELIDARYRDQR